MKNQTQTERKNTVNVHVCPSASPLRAQDDLENAIDRSAAILETLAVVVKTTDNSEHPLLSDSAVEGLQCIARELATDLRECFITFTKSQSSKAA